MKRAGYVRGHLVDAHGYGSRYVETTSLSPLMDEHERLHADVTAKNLDHDHERSEEASRGDTHAPQP